ncbi:MAG: thiol:disulfide interchange protein DsbA/DsbL [Pseudomonadota bacterium]
MRLSHLILAAAALIAGSAFATPADPKSGAEYQTLGTPQTTQAAGKSIEVIEFFMYHCPACNAFEPALLDWVKKQGANITFRRIHIPHLEQNDPEAHLFLTLDAMQIENAMHAKVLHTWHVEHRRLKDDADNLDWAIKNGLDKDKFLAAYNSFGVMAKLRGLNRMTGNYQVDSTPTLVVDGRYLTNPSMVEEANRASVTRENAFAATFQVLEALAASARKAQH